MVAVAAVLWLRRCMVTHTHLAMRKTIFTPHSSQEETCYSVPATTQFQILYPKSKHEQHQMHFLVHSVVLVFFQIKLFFLNLYNTKTG